MTFDQFAQALDGIPCGSGYSCRCPAHDDDVRSLSVGVGTKHPIVFRCHRAAGCTEPEIIEALKARGLWPLHGSFVPVPRQDIVKAKATTKKAREVRGKIVATYSYVDENDRELFQAVRFDPKDFRQRHRGPDGKWIWSLRGVRRVLYRLPRVLKAVRLDKRVFVCEGEKDADNLARELGVVATTCAMGAEKWLTEYNEHLRGARVVVLPDWDTPGLAHAQLIVKSLRDIARSAVIVLPLTTKPFPKADVSDWLAAGAQLEHLICRTEIMENMARYPTH